MLTPCGWVCGTRESWAYAAAVARENRPASNRFIGSPDRIVDGDELGAIGECRFDLEVVDYLGDAFHDLLPSQHLGAGLHQLGDGLAVARAFQDEVGD